MNTPDILVIGGGIIGCSLAREVAKVGARVTVLERGTVGGQSSSAAAGLLVPTFGPTPAGPLLELCRQAALMYESWANELRTDGAGDVGYRKTGLLTVCLDETEMGVLQRALPEERFPGRHAEWLDARQLREREPALTERVLGAAYYPDDAHLEPARLVKQVARVSELAGVAIREQEPVKKLECRAGRIVAVETTRDRYEAGTVVVTAGAWTGELANTLGLHLPTRPVKGQMVMADCRVPPVRTPLHAGDALLVPWPDGRLAIGVTLEEAGFDDRVRLESLRQILDRVIDLVPAVGRLALDFAWAGLRPATPDERPYMGRAVGFDNVWVSAGHYRKGTLLAPICAQLMARSVLGSRLVEELEPFQPDRRS